MKIEAKYLEVEAKVRYWEDASVNGFDDWDGKEIPSRKGDFWNPVIRLEDGKVMGWPLGIIAKVHYKVCDEGTYFLLNRSMKQVAKYYDYYVPDRYMCFGREGYGDYVIMRINGQGFIEGYHGNPYLSDPDKDTNWVTLP